jgi:hypothetical protein
MLSQAIRPTLISSTILLIVENLAPPGVSADTHTKQKIQFFSIARRNKV